MSIAPIRASSVNVFASSLGVVDHEAMGVGAATCPSKLSGGRRRMLAIAGSSGARPTTATNSYG